MIQHFVCFKFKPDTSQVEIQKHMEMFASLEEKISQITSYRGGKVLEGFEGAEKYDTAHYVTFANKSDVDIYFYHEAHQEFIESNKNIWADILVIDSEIQ